MIFLHTMPPAQRKDLRLKHYDYSQTGAYFTTVCIHQRINLFGRIVDGKMQLNQLGSVVLACWQDLPKHYQNLELDAFVVMPNHVHGILTILDNIDTVGAIHESPLPKNPVKRRRMLLPKMIGRFKMNAAKRINHIHGTAGQPVWQRNYFEHIIRGDKALNKIRQYIVTNPQRWEIDRENPGKTRDDEFDLWIRSFATRPG